MTTMGKDPRTGNPRAQLRLSVPPDPHHSGYVRQQLLAFAAEHRVADDDFIDFVGAIGEAVANAIEHAKTNAPIEIHAWLHGDDRLFATVRDHGCGFTPSDRTIVPELPDAFAERGRGLPIMRSCASTFAVQTAPGEGTRITLGRYIRRAALDRQAV